MKIHSALEIILCLGSVFQAFKNKLGHLGVWIVLEASNLFKKVKTIQLWITKGCCVRQQQSPILC
jgi:hypothetical protein